MKNIVDVGVHMVVEVEVDFVEEVEVDVTVLMVHLMWLKKWQRMLARQRCS